MGAWAVYNSWCRNGFEVSLKAKFANCLFSVLISVFSASEHIGLEGGNPSAAHLSVLLCGDKGQRILQGPRESTWTPKSPVMSNNEVYGWSGAQRWHCHCGPCAELESSVRAALDWWLLQGSSVWVISLLCLNQAPQTKLEHGAAGDTHCMMCEMELNNLLSCSSEE